MLESNPKTLRDQEVYLPLCTLAAAIEDTASWLRHLVGVWAIDARDGDLGALPAAHNARRSDARKQLTDAHRALTEMLTWTINDIRQSAPSGNDAGERLGAAYLVLQDRGGSLFHAIKRLRACKPESPEARARLLHVSLSFLAYADARDGLEALCEAAPAVKRRRAAPAVKPSTRLQADLARLAARTLPKGVSRSGKGFRARISVGGVEIHLGTYATAEDASRAYQAAKRHLDR